MNSRSFFGLRGTIVLVTGASSGIGEAIARGAARHGAHVVLVARRLAELERVGTEIRAGGGAADWICCDLTEANGAAELVAEVLRRFGRIDICVSNAGGGWYGRVWEMPWESAESLIELNVVAGVRLALSLMPKMIEARHGHIITIGSIAGKLPAQGVAIYAATKAFLESFCRSAYRETRRTGVAVSLVAPGAVKTPFFETARQRSGGSRIPLSGTGVSAARVAKAVVRVMRSRRRVIYVPFFLRLVPLVELAFGWVLDILGPIALNRKPRGRRPERPSRPPRKSARIPAAPAPQAAR